MDEQSLAALKAALAASTQGEWEVRSAYSHAVMANGAQVAITGDIMQVDQDRPLANAAFIVAAHEHLPALLAENERLRAALEPFAEQYQFWKYVGDEVDVGIGITVGDLHRAADALTPTDTP